MRKVLKPMLKMISITNMANKILQLRCRFLLIPHQLSQIWIIFMTFITVSESVTGAKLELNVKWLLTLKSICIIWNRCKQWETFSAEVINAEALKVHAVVTAPLEVVVCTICPLKCASITVWISQRIQTRIELITTQCC